MNKYTIAARLTEAGATDAFVKDVLYCVEASNEDDGDRSLAAILLRFAKAQEENMARSQYNLNEARENASAARVVLTTLDAAQAEGEQA